MIGKSVPNRRYEKVTGRAKFTDDPISNNKCLVGSLSCKDRKQR